MSKRCVLFLGILMLTIHSSNRGIGNRILLAAEETAEGTQETSASDVSGEIQEFFQRLETADAQTRGVIFRFRQKVRLKLTDDSTELKGKISYQKPQRLRIDYYYPQRQIAILDEERFLLYIPDYNQAWVKSRDDFLSQQYLPMIFFDLSGRKQELLKNYYVSLNYPNGNYHLLLQPRQKNNAVQISLYLENRKFFPKRIRLTSPETEVEVIVTNVNLNPNFRDTDFSLKLPPDCLIIK